MISIHSPTMQNADKLSNSLILPRTTAIAQAMSRENQWLTTISKSEKPWRRNVIAISLLS